MKHSKINISAKVYLRNKIIEFLNEYNSNYFGQVSTICQSSGFGKSRECESLVAENFFVIFCCLLDKDSIDYPLNPFIDLLNEERKISFKLKSQPTKPAIVYAYDMISPTLVYGLANDKPYLLLFMQLGLKNEKPYIENIKDGGSLAIIH
ncbi:unnamed protein product [Brachionus calyciflorus]|uniref:Uncharacterized protein n=1 Tax=Brachionus calyciflorus TaxID=104777 RepID=A0A813ZYJ3_9BILA|nr:unnamed protein product [Brachionus calyciflorus]